MADINSGAMPQQPPYYYMRPRRSRWWIPLLIIGIIILIFVIGFFIIAGVAGSFFAKEQFEVKANSVLYLDLGKVTQEHTESNPFAFLAGNTMNSFWDVLHSIERAKNDEHIKGIYYRASGSTMGWAMTQEMLVALDDFKSSGKFIYAFIEAGTETDYMKALPADKIFMSEEGLLEMNGFGISSMFLKGLFDKIGIDFYVKGYEDFKTAGESLARKNFGDSSRYQLRVLLDNRYKTFIDYVAKYRKLKPDFIKEVLNRGVYTADSLKVLGFIDSLAFESDVKDMLTELSYKDFVKDRSDKKLHLVSINDYASSVNSEKPSKVKTPRDQQIAILFASGQIIDTPEGKMFSNENQITSKAYCGYLKKLREDDNIKAIILRIDSPGGSVIASDAIWQEIQKTNKVKPVYASMSNVAASGGYYLSIACDTIIAEPTTITGSIGVISAIPNFTKLIKNLDITVDTLSTGAASQDLNVFYPFNSKQTDKIDALMGNVYFRFIDKVAKSRKLDKDYVRSIAKGRVWTGTDAKRIGLVDTIGGLQTAINIAKRRLGFSETEKVRFKLYPEKKDEFEWIREIIGHGSDNDESEFESVNSHKLPLLSKILGKQPSDAMMAWQTLPMSLRQQLSYFMDIVGIAQKEPILMEMPYLIDN